MEILVILIGFFASGCTGNSLKIGQPIVNGLNKVTWDERSTRFKNFHTKSPLAPL